MNEAPSSRQLADRLRSSGLRVTGPRLAILAALEIDGSHPTAELLFERLRPEHPSLSLSTVYKTLEAFLQRGLCRRVVGDGTRLRVDGILTSHDHAVCRGCGRVFDVERDRYPLPPPPPALPEGLIVTGMRVEFEVECPQCRQGGTVADHVRQCAPMPVSEGQRQS
jgi:Fur family peroxide stress response transcriptional regulator